MSSISSRNSTPFQYSVATGASPGVYHLRAHRLVRCMDMPQASRPARVHPAWWPAAKSVLAPLLKPVLRLALKAEAGLRICLVPLLVVLLALLFSSPARAATMPGAEAWLEIAISSACTL